ncbi:hypothetical protein [Sphingomonas beigongshangi]|uniref:hypothetical protein n=1 Tax=Sphingomonas beigongshangi TaxID=2782540 RepID=UPI00193BCF55|nr:hypothetical protein [Sphingomonas beigongshangi]
MQRNDARSDLASFATLVADDGWIESRSTFDGVGSRVEISKDGLVFFSWIYRGEADAGVRLADDTIFGSALPEWYEEPRLDEIFQQLGIASHSFLVAAEHRFAIKALLEDYSWHKARASHQMAEVRASYASLDLMKHSDANKIKSSFLLRHPWLAGRTER